MRPSKLALVGALLLTLSLMTVTAFADPVPDAPNAERLAGENRWETAAEISQANWEETFTVTVFLASGDVFADSLAGGPSTFFEGPLLLVHDPGQPGFPDGDLSDPTRAELERLEPCKVEAWGGPARITDEMIQEAESYTAAADDPKCGGDLPPGGEIDRLQRILESRRS